MNQTPGIPGPALLVFQLVAALYGAVVAQLFFGFNNLQDFAKDDAHSWRVTMFVAVFALCQFLALPVWGAMSDRLNPKGVLFFSILLVFVGAILPLLPIPVPRILISRIIFAMVTCGAALALAACANMVEVKRRPALVAPVLSSFFAGGLLMTVCGWVVLRWGQLFGATLASTFWPVLALAALTLLGIHSRLEEGRPKSELYRGTNAMSHLWHGFGVVLSETGFAVVALLSLSGFVAAQGLLWVGPVVLFDEGAAGATSIPALVLFVLPWFAAAVGAGVFMRFAPDSKTGKSGRGIFVGLLLLLLILLSVFFNAGWVLGTLLACGISFCSVVLACFGFAAVMASIRSRELGAATGAAFAFWLAGFAVSALLFLTAAASGNVFGLGYMLVAAGSLALWPLWFVLRSRVLEPMMVREA